MDALVITLVAAALIALLGIYMIATGNTALLHGYHYATTPPEQRPALARACGAGLVLCGVGLALLSCNSWLAVTGIVLLAASVALICMAIVHYNGSLISGGSLGGSLRCLKPAVRIAVTAAIGLAIAAVAAVPGIHMIMTGDVSALHSYHYANVAEAEIPAFATGEGLSMMGLGLAILVFMVSLAGMASRRPAPRWSKVLTVVSVVLLAASLAALLLVIVCFNGSLVAE